MKNLKNKTLKTTSILLSIFITACAFMLQSEKMDVSAQSLINGNTTIYLPLVLNQPVDAQATPKDSCLQNEQEKAVEALFKNDPGQNRLQMICNPILAEVAHERAMDMGLNNYFSHVNLEGFGPNYLVSEEGYLLPSYYGVNADANNIESIAAGYTSAEAVWNAWLSSDLHRVHVLGEYSFYAEQIEYGIGYYNAPNSTYQHYWVIITAKPGP